MLTLTIIGNLGGDAVVKDFNGQKFISFNVAHSERYTDQNGQKVEKTTWVSCTKKGESAVLPYLKKGMTVYLRGDLSIKLYTDQNGQIQAGVNCRVKELQLVGGQKQENDPF